MRHANEATVRTTRSEVIIHLRDIAREFRAYVRARIALIHLSQHFYRGQLKLLTWNGEFARVASAKY